MQSSQIRIGLTISFAQFPELKYLLDLHGRGQRQFELLRLIEMGLRYQAHLEGHGFKRAEEDSKTTESRSTLEQSQAQNKPMPKVTPKKTTAPALPTETVKAKETKEVISAKSAPFKKTAATPAAEKRVKAQEQGEKEQSYQSIPDDVFYDPTSEIYETEKIEPKNDGSQEESTKQDFSLLGNFLS